MKDTRIFSISRKAYNRVFLVNQTSSESVEADLKDYGFERRRRDSTILKQTFLRFQQQKNSNYF